LNPREWDKKTALYLPIVNIQHMTFEGSIDSTSILHAVKLFNNLRTIHLSRFFRLNISEPNHTFPSWDDLYASLPTILDDYTPLRRRTKRYTAPPNLHDRFTETFVDKLLMVEDASAFKLVYCPKLEHLTLTGFTIDSHDAELLLDLLAMRQDDRKSVPTSESSGLILTLSDCFTPNVREGRSNLDSKEMDYLQAQKFFRQRTNDLKKRIWD
jgi:hypothetical protein